MSQQISALSLALLTATTATAVVIGHRRTRRRGAASRTRRPARSTRPRAWAPTAGLLATLVVVLAGLFAMAFGAGSG